MNRREREVFERYKAEGWRPLRNGAPDFVMLKTDGDKIEAMMGVEVKGPRDKMRYEQSIYRRIFEKAGIPFKVEVVK